MEPTQTSTRIAAILIETSRPEELAEFYRRGFDLTAPTYFGEDHLGFTLANTYLGFDRNLAAAQAPPRNISIWFYIQDIYAVFDRLLALGARERSAPNAEESPGEILATLYDPDGNVIGLISQSDN